MCSLDESKNDLGDDPSAKRIENTLYHDIEEEVHLHLKNETGFDENKNFQIS